jgi:hypothetical protein
MYSSISGLASWGAHGFSVRNRSRRRQAASPQSWSISESDDDHAARSSTLTSVDPARSRAAVGTSSTS